MLSEDEYRMLDFYDGEEAFSQVNHYFDTPSFKMWDSMTVIRVRQIKDSYELTVKKKNSGRDANGVITMDEHNLDIPEETAEGLIDNRLDIKDYLPEDPVYDNVPLKKIGSITTLRRKIRINEQLPMAELDKSVYSGMVDYELEWEIDDRDYQSAVGSLEKIGLGLEGRAVGKSKYGRLVDIMRKGKE